MLWAMIKNNTKLMFRNKMILIGMMIAPVLVIAALSSAFHDLLNTGYSKDNMSIGYYFEDGSMWKELESELVDGFKEAGVTLKDYRKEQMEYVIKSGEVQVFLLADEDGCTIGSQDKESIQTRICEYTIHQFMEEYNLAIMSIEYAMITGETVERAEVKTGELPYTKTASASDYYGMIEIIYFLWCSMIFLTAVVSSERKNRIQSRYAIAPVNSLSLYLGKFIPCAVIATVTVTVSTILATVLFHINWGTNPATIGILLLTLMAGTAFGIVLIYLFNNLAASVVVLFATVWLFGFVGGSFETYMYASYPEAIKKLSPLYHVNRTIVEFSTMGQSNYAKVCVLYLSAMLVICMLLGMFLMKRRMEEK